MTDFGSSGPYAASMKGVIYTLAPGALIVDISHDIQPQQVEEAAYVLSRCYADFPANTLHVVVVDPGVGSSRQILAVQAGVYRFLAPDNGVLKYIFDSHPEACVFALTNRSFFREPVSNLFHGRDIFAPAAARIERGEPLETAGPVCRPSHPGTVQKPGLRADGISGEIVYFDRFGSGVTNIPGAWIAGKTIRCVECRGLTLNRLSRTYQDVEAGEALALIGSLDTVELSIRSGSAKEQLGLAVGDQIMIAF